MAFITKEWKDRLVEFAGRRKLTNVATGEETIVDVARNEGAVSQEGDAFSATNMNGLEQRIKNEFDNVNSNLTKLENDLTHIEYVSLYETSALAVMAYIKQKWAEYGIYQGGFSFNFLVNNANWYSGTMYSDNTNTWWGIIQERNGGIDTIKTYQYFGNNVGADSVLPFKSQQDVDNAYNTGYSAGYSAISGKLFNNWNSQNQTGTYSGLTVGHTYLAVYTSNMHNFGGSDNYFTSGATDVTILAAIYTAARENIAATTSIIKFTATSSSVTLYQGSYGRYSMCFCDIT